jgi:hypothetical protein
MLVVRHGVRDPSAYTSTSLERIIFCNLGSGVTLFVSSTESSSRHS